MFSVDGNFFKLFQGEVEFRSVLYVPGMAPLNNEDIVNPKTKNIRLYVKRVFISDDFDGELVSMRDLLRTLVAISLAAMCSGCHYFYILVCFLLFGNAHIVDFDLNCSFPDI